MDRQVWRHCTNQGQHSEVAHDDRVGARFADPADRVRQFGKIIGMGQDIERDIDFDLVLMRKGDRSRQLVRSEVAAAGPQAEAAPGQVDSVRPESDSHAQPLEVAGRRQQFRVFIWHIS